MLFSPYFSYSLLYFLLISTLTFTSVMLFSPNFSNSVIILSSSLLFCPQFSSTPLSYLLLLSFTSPPNFSFVLLIYLLPFTSLMQFSPILSSFLFLSSLFSTFLFSFPLPISPLVFSPLYFQFLLFSPHFYTPFQLFDAPFSLFLRENFFTSILGRNFLFHDYLYQKPLRSCQPLPCPNVLFGAYLLSALLSSLFLSL